MSYELKSVTIRVKNTPKHCIVSNDFISYGIRYMKHE